MAAAGAAGARFPRCAAVFGAWGLLLAALPPAAWAGHPKLSTQAKLALVRGMIADIGIARQVFPRGKKPVILAADGRVLNAAYIQQAAIQMPPAAKPGQRLQITNLHFHGKSILVELNGGFTKTHWYDHLQIGMGAQMTPVAQAQQESGSEISVRFPAGVPADLTTARLKQILSSVLDWNLNATYAAAVGERLPPRLEKAIDRHAVLVGMTRGMVLAAKGRPEQKYHQTDAKSGVEYSEWVYGHPPGDTTFVNIVGERVVRVVDYKANGTKVVQTTPQAPMPSQTATAARGSAANGSGNASDSADNARPTLRRPGDNSGNGDQPVSGPGPILIPGAPPPPPGTQNGPPPIGMPGGPGNGAPTGPGMPNPTPGGPGQSPNGPCCGGPL